MRRKPRRRFWYSLGGHVRQKVVEYGWRRLSLYQPDVLLGDWFALLPGVNAWCPGWPGDSGATSRREAESAAALAFVQLTPAPNGPARPLRPPVSRRDIAPRSEAGQFAADCAASAGRFGLKSDVVERVAWPWHGGRAARP